MKYAKKKFLLFIFAVFLIVGLLPASAMGEESNFTITDGVLTAYSGTDTEVTIPDGVTTIGEKAFYSKGLTSVTIPSTVKRIEKQAFYANPLKTVNLSEGLEYIGPYAFDEIYTALDLVIPASVTQVEAGAFGVLGEDHVCSVTFLNPNTVIPDNAMEYFAKVNVFGEAGSTAESFVSDWKTKKPDAKLAFLTHDTVISVDPEEVQLHRTDKANLSVKVSPSDSNTPWIRWDSSEKAIATVDKNGTVTGLAEGSTIITAKTGKLSATCTVSIVIDEDESDFKINANGTITEYIGHEPANLIIPEEISGIQATAIADNAFCGNANIETVTLPASITKIGESAFENCRSLKSINLENVTDLSRKSFSGCQSLAEVTLSKKLTSIPEEAFRSCGKLTEIDIPGTAEDVCEAAFSGCTALSDIKLREGVRVIHNMAFFHCPIDTLRLPASFEQLGDREVGDPFEEPGKTDADPTMTNITVAAGNPNFKAIDGILYNKDASKAIFCPRGRVTAMIPDTVTELDDYSFFMCFQLKKVNLPESLKIVGEHVFQYDEEIVKMELPEGLEIVKEAGFFGCEKWEGVDRIPSTVREIGPYGFAECLGTKLTIPEGITRIEEFSFWGYEDQLEEINLPSTLTHIDKSAFSWAKHVKKLVVPEGVTFIGDEAFARLDSLKSLQLPSTLKSVGRQAFMGPADKMGVLKKVVIPEALETFGDGAFRNREDSLIMYVTDLKGLAAEYAENNGFSVKLQNAKISKVTLAKTSYTYDAKSKKPAIKSVTGILNDDSITLNPENYKVTYPLFCKNAGAYKVKVSGTGDFDGSSVTVSYAIGKAKNSLTAKGKSVTVKASKLKKKSQTVKVAKAMTLKKGQGKTSYKLVGVTKAKFKKFFQVNPSKGTIKIKKGLKKGSYKVKIQLEAKGNNNYIAGKTQVTVTVKVK